MAFGHLDRPQEGRTNGLTSFPAFTAKSDFEPGAEAEWQFRKAKHRIIVLAAQIFQDGKQFEMGIQTVTACHVNLLVSGRKISVRQQQAVAEERITEERAVITTADYISVKRKVEPIAHIIN